MKIAVYSVATCRLFAELSMAGERGLCPFPAPPLGRRVALAPETGEVRTEDHFGHSPSTEELGVEVYVDLSPVVTELGVDA